MTDPHDDDAMDWAIRMGDADADWDAFTTWLEADPTRAAPYDCAASALLDAEAAVAALSADPVTSATAAAWPASSSSASSSMPTSADIVDLRNAREARRPGERTPVARWVGGAAAAALVGAISLGAWTQMPRPYAVETAAGEQRTVTLEDGSSIVLAGGSKVRLDHADARVASVERGEMLFSVRHDADHPFAVTVGDLKLVDLGTVFDVHAGGRRTQVSVGEGAVMVDPEGAALRLGPGDAVVADGTWLRRRRVVPADVGAWRDGRLAFDDAMLTEVAADLSRQLGRSVHVTPAIGARRFRGTLDLHALRNRPDVLGRLLDVRVREDGESWTLDVHR